MGFRRDKQQDDGGQTPYATAGSPAPLRRTRWQTFLWYALHKVSIVAFASVVVLGAAGVATASVFANSHPTPTPPSDRTSQVITVPVTISTTVSDTTATTPSSAAPTTTGTATTSSSESTSPSGASTPTSTEPTTSASASKPTTSATKPKSRPTTTKPKPPVVTYKTFTETVSIAQPASQTVQDPSMAKGTSKVVQRGHPGKAAISYRQKYIDGEKSGAPVKLSSSVTTPAVPTITHVGTHVEPPPTTTHQQPPPPPANKAHSVSLSVACSAPASVSFAASGPGSVSIKVSGVASASGGSTVSATSSKAGTFTATATASDGWPSMSWSGPTTCHQS